MSTLNISHLFVHARTCTCVYLYTSFKEKSFEPWAASNQGLDTILGHLVTPGDVELLQQRTSLTRGKDTTSRRSVQRDAEFFSPLILTPR